MSGQPKHLKDVVENSAFKSLSPQKLSKYKHQLNTDWKHFVNKTNIDFLSQNKLYLKTIQDYLTREFKATNGP